MTNEDIETNFLTIFLNFLIKDLNVVDGVIFCFTQNDFIQNKNIFHSIFYNRNLNTNSMKLTFYTISYYRYYR